MELLALDTFSEVCSAALLSSREGGGAAALLSSREGGGTAALLSSPESGAPAPIRTTSEPRSHASQLAIFAQELLAEHASKSNGSPIDGILVVQGPGSYTGLRIGVSTAKGLAWSLDVPLFAISTLHFLGLCSQRLTSQIPADVKSGLPRTQVDETLFVVIPARVGEVFAARFCVTNGNLERQTEDKAFSIEDFEAELHQMNGVGRVVSNHEGPKKAVIKASLSFEKVEPYLPNLAVIITNQIEKFRVQDLNSFEPAYLKDFVARKAAKNIFEKLPF